MTDYSVARDYWNRPYVSLDGKPLEYVKGRKTPVNAIAYTRMSTMAGTLDDSGGLIDWVAARAMIGMVKSRSIHSQISHLVSAFDDPWAAPEGKKPLKELVRKAQEAGGSDEAAGEGTAFHGLTECYDRGMKTEYVPEHMAKWLLEYQLAMQDWEPLHVEPFVVCDELKVAGSPDRYLRHRKTGQIVCADLKTGSSEPDFPLKVTVQVAIGAHSVIYDQETGSREPVEDCDQKQGILIHCPIRAGGTPRCDLYLLDLETGWANAELSYRVREARKMEKLVKL